jgi:hypothetical protein
LSPIRTLISSGAAAIWFVFWQLGLGVYLYINVGAGLVAFNMKRKGRLVEGVGR